MLKGEEVGVEGGGEVGVKGGGVVKWVLRGGEAGVERW